MVAQAQRIINVMRETVDKTTKNGAKIGYRYGVVGSMAGAGEVTVMLAADDVLTEGVRITDGAYLNAGDYVLVAQTEEGDSWIAEVLAYSGNFVLGFDPQRGRIYAPTSSTVTVPPTHGSPGTEGQLLFSGGADGYVYWADNFAVELRLQVKNTSGSTIGAGKVVYITGASGQVPTVALADADFEATSASTIGVTTGSIANNATGYIVTKGVLRGINTSAYAEGTEVWLSPGVGDFTDTRPPAPQHGVRVGNIVKSHASSGELLVDIHNGLEVSELHDVRLGTLSNGEVLVYDSSSGYWTNGSGGGVSYGAVTSETSFGASPANGVATSVARSDHTHGTPTNPVTAHEGAADPHTGYLQESVISGLGTPSLTLSTSNSAGAGTTVIGAGATIAAFDATAPTTAAFGDAAAAGSAGYAARRDHTHGMMTNPVTGHEAAADPHTGYVLESTGATQTIVTTSTSATPLIVKGAASQTANLFEAQTSAASAGAYFDSVGRLQTVRELRLRGVPNDPGQIRLTYLTNPGVIMRSDGSDFYFLLTANGDPFGNWNSLRPFAFNTTTGLVTLANGAAVSSSLTLGGNNVETQNNKAAANGYASLDSGTKIPIAQVPTGTTSSTVSLGNHTHVGTSTLDVESSTITLSGSVVETDFFNYSVAGGTLGTTGSIRLKLWGTITNNTGGNRTITLKIVYGATTMFADVTASIGSNAAARAWRVDADIAANNATNAQTCSGVLYISAPASAANGTGDLATADLFTRSFYGTASEDSTAAKTLKVTWTHSANDATLTTTRTYASAILE